MNIATKELEGRPHYVVPTVLITVGVHIGSRGALYYPKAELAKTARLWNSKPVVVYHPGMESGGFADNPAVFNKQKIGVLFNSRFDGTRLRADAWIDKERVGRVDRRVLEAIESQRVGEVSTGLVTDVDESHGTFNGRSYVATVTSMHPDHLAILPDQKGACSVEDGAGFIHNHLHVLALALPCTA